MTSFIYEGHINHALCDKIIEYHKNSQQKYEGVNYNLYGENCVNKNVKDSTDVPFLDEILYTEYCEELQKIINNYIQIYPSCNFYSPFGIIEILISVSAPSAAIATEFPDEEPVNLKRFALLEPIVAPFGTLKSLTIVDI